jgi:hypothetical protein
MVCFDVPITAIRNCNVNNANVQILIVKWAQRLFHTDVCAEFLNSNKDCLSVDWAAVRSYRCMRAGVRPDRKTTASRWNPEGRWCVGREGCNLRPMRCWWNGRKQRKAARTDGTERETCSTGNVSWCCLYMNCTINVISGKNSEWFGRGYLKTQLLYEAKRERK